MSSSGFNFDERAIKKVAQQAADEVGRQFERELERLRRSHSGKPVDDVKRHVRQAFRRLDATATESEITDYAVAISEGSRIKVRVDRIR